MTMTTWKICSYAVLTQDDPSLNYIGFRSEIYTIFIVYVSFLFTHKQYVEINPTLICIVF